MTKILLVEDDVRLAALTQEYLQQQGMEVEIEHRGDLALHKVTEFKPNLLILDIMLPGIDGLEVCRRLRPIFQNPILMLTAKEDDIDQIVGLELGADDYVVKPIEPRVLLARIKALLRRFNDMSSDEITDTSKSNRTLKFGALSINASTQTVFLNEQKISLTSNEFQLLLLLASHAGQVLNRDEILSSIRGVAYDGQDRSVDIRISRLRKKLGDDTQEPYRIKTIWGKGYLFVEDAWDK